MESFFQISILFQIIGQKTKNIQTAWILIEVKCITYISMDLTRQALQTNGKLFSNFEIFQIS